MLQISQSLCIHGLVKLRASNLAISQARVHLEVLLLEETGLMDRRDPLRNWCVL